MIPLDKTMIDSTTVSTIDSTIDTNLRKPYSKIIIQRPKCTTDKYQKYPMCNSCKNVTSSNEPCRFRNMRAFKKQKLRPIPYNPYFISTKTQRNLDELKENVGIPVLTLEEMKYVNESVRPFLKRELDEEIAYINAHQPKVKKRMHALNDRHNCDYCYTSIFNLYFMCGICGKELCKNCYHFNWKIKERDELNRLTSCSTLYQQHHTKLSFVPLIKYNQADIEKLHIQCNNSTGILIGKNNIVK